MTPERKNELTNQLIAIILELASSPDVNINLGALEIENRNVEEVEMLTIKECMETINGLTENTIRQMVLQNKIKHIRTGQGKRGKILINKVDLIKYFS